MMQTIGFMLLAFLKLIGFVLLFLAAFLVAVILLVLFVPLRYRVALENEKKAEADRKSGKAGLIEKARGRLTVTWLFRFIRVTLTYDAGGMRNEIRLAGIDVQKALAVLKQRKAKKSGKSDRPKKSRRSDRPKKSAKAGKPKNNTKEKDAAQAPPEASVQESLQGDSACVDVPDMGGKQALPERGENHASGDTCENASRNACENASGNISDHAPEKEAAQKETDFKEAASKEPDKEGKGEEASKEAIPKKTAPGKAEEGKKNSGLPLKGKIDSFRTKGAQLHQEVTDESNIRAVKLLIREICFLLRHYKPRKVETDIAFSLANPAVTGKAVGLLSMFPFSYGRTFRIVPDFVSNQLYVEGTFMARGKVSAIFFLVSVLRLIRNKEFMQIVHRLMGQGR